MKKKATLFKGQPKRIIFPPSRHDKTRKGNRVVKKVTEQMDTRPAGIQFESTEDPKEEQRQRSIPSMVDGLNTLQRKFLFNAFNNPKFQEEIYAQHFSCHVWYTASYLDGHTLPYTYIDDRIVLNTIIGMGQKFVGTNNIPLFDSDGNFCSHWRGGKDASGDYYTKLTPITRHIFYKADELLPNFLDDKGRSIEPTWYLPIIPMVLVNGCDEKGTGRSTFVPNHNPRDIIANLERLLKGESVVPMDPWYKGFKGTIRRTDVEYVTEGVVKEKEGEDALLIIELPIRSWTQEEYMQFLKTEKDKERLQGFRVCFDEESFSLNEIFEVRMTTNQMNEAKKEGLMKTFKLTSTFNTCNMYLFDANGVIKKYDTAEEILEDFFHFRLDFYERRKTAILHRLEKDILQLENTVRFLRESLEGKIALFGSGIDLEAVLEERGFKPLPKVEVYASISMGTASKRIPKSGYHYLKKIPIGAWNWDKMIELEHETENKKAHRDELTKKSSQSLWLDDLHALRKQLDEQDTRDAEKVVERKRMLQLQKSTKSGVGV